MIYNKFMGRIDLMDHNCNAYRIGIRGKKGWWSIFTWGVDVSMQNSWILYRDVNIGIFLLNFMIRFVQYYLKRYRNISDHHHSRFSTKKGSIDCGVSDS